MFSVVRKSAREKILRRLREPDEELEAALDRLFKNYYCAYCTIKEYLEDPERLEEWREAEKPSQEWRKGFYFDQALRVLEAALT